MSSNELHTAPPSPTGTATSPDRRTRRTTKQEQFIAVLLTAPTLKQAAERLGIGYATAKRWYQRAEFQQAFAAYRQEVLSHSIERLHHAFALAVETLSAAMTDPQTPAATRVAAARTVIETGRHELILEQQHAEIAELRGKAQDAALLMEQKGLLPYGMNAHSFLRLG